MSQFTSTERELMRELSRDIGYCIAAPAAAIDAMRHSHRCGGGAGFTYTFTNSAIVGRWHEWIPVSWAGPNSYRPEGEPIQWRQGELLREAAINYTRLHAWCTALPEAVRAEALTHWRADNRDAGDQLTLAVIAATNPEPALFDIGEPHA